VLCIYKILRAPAAHHVLLDDKLARAFFEEYLYLFDSYIRNKNIINFLLGKSI
jgi:hypothetical protein